MTVPLFDIRAQHASLGEAFERTVRDAIASGHFIGGEAVAGFERDFAEYLAARHVVSCASGTDALEIALEALGIGPGDEVIVPAMTWVSTAEAVARVGAVPVFADVLPGEWTLDPVAAERAITDRTRAMIPVHLYGRPARIEALTALCRSHGLSLIEDCAQAHGAMVGGAKVGTLGDAAIFSFFPTKNLGTLGDGGAMVFANEVIARRARLIASHGQETRHHHVLIGRNSRLDALHAQVLALKLPHLDDWIAAKGRVAQHYRDAWVDLPLECPPVCQGARHGWHVFAITCEDRDRLRTHCAEQGVETGIHYPAALTGQPAFAPFGADPASSPVAADLARTQVSVPIYPELTDEQVVKVVRAVRTFFA